MTHDAKHKTLPLFEASRPTIEELYAKHGPTFGIRQFDKIDSLRGSHGDTPIEAQRERQLRHAREVADRIILAEYAKLGIDPIYASDGMLASPSLLRSLDRMPAAKGESKPVEGEDMR